MVMGILIIPEWCSLVTHCRITSVSLHRGEHGIHRAFSRQAIVMLAAWRGSRPLALGLFAVVMVASLATYLHHATDTLKLSF